MYPIDIGLTPNNGGKSIVGLPTWLWVDSPNATQYRPASNKRVKSKCIRGTCVTVQGWVTKVAWNMGDGESFVCRNAGTKYKKRYGGDKSPNCGHFYDRDSDRQSGGKYRIRATTYWHWTWQGGGMSGTYDFTTDATRRLRIVEVEDVRVR